MPFDPLAGGVVGSSAREELSLGRREWLDFGEGAVLVVGPDGPGRNVKAERRIYGVVGPTGGLGECWVEVGDGADLVSAEGALRVALDTDGVSRFLTSNEFTRDPASELANRPGERLWIGSALLLGLFGAVQMWARRSELALLRALGTTRAELMILVGFETFLILCAATVV